MIEIDQDWLAWKAFSNVEDISILSFLHSGLITLDLT